MRFAQRTTIPPAARRLLLFATGILMLGIGIGIGGTLGIPGVATTRANGGMHHACASVYTGQMRYVYAPDQCATGERAISWSQGPSGISGYEIIRGELVTVDIGETEIAHLNCPSGKKVLGGGGVASNIIDEPALPEPNMFWSYPFGDDTWRVAVHNDTSQVQEMRAFAICAEVAS